MTSISAYVSAPAVFAKAVDSNAARVFNIVCSLTWIKGLAASREVFKGATHVGEGDNSIQTNGVTPLPMDSHQGCV
ncbi:hypothetical protein PI125_g2349 [Phytophthora idaei]|nr:hypothetical protein PI125_g2349 [Phytophthora idaei]KAG3139140.1 hypothetical protein PI126_g16601 [Phytophthora idaei]